MFDPQVLFSKSLRVFPFAAGYERVKQACASAQAAEIAGQRTHTPPLHFIRKYCK